MAYNILQIKEAAHKAFKEIFDFAFIHFFLLYNVPARCLKNQFA